MHGAPLRRILGIDPGSRHLGWGIVGAGARTGTACHLASGVIDARAGPLAGRLRHQAEALEGVLERWRPQAAAMEAVFHGVNARSALVLGQARGAVLLTLARWGLAVDEYSPARIKQSVAASGRADKAQVARMVALLLGHRAPLRPDESDALAVAWCHTQACAAALGATT